jgi:hypothetical protein
MRWREKLGLLLVLMGTPSHLARRTTNDGTSVYGCGVEQGSKIAAGSADACAFAPAKHSTSDSTATQHGTKRAHKLGLGVWLLTVATAGYAVAAVAAVPAAAVVAATEAGASPATNGTPETRHG